MFRNSRAVPRATFGLLAVLLVLASGCSQKMTFQSMGSQPRYMPLSSSDLFPNGQSAQAPVPGTVARGHLQDDTALFTGKVDNVDVTTFPFPITRSDLARGQERYDVYCAPCHGATGNGQGVIVQRGFSPPPTFHDPLLRQSPAGHLFDVMTNGFGVMPSYASQVPVRDRWLIAAYIRALQLSQNAKLDDIPPDQRSQVGGP